MNKEKGLEKIAILRASGSLKRGISLDPITKAKANPKSLRFAINAMCYDCQGRDADHNVKYRIGTCGIPECPLWPQRPYQNMANLPPESIENTEE